MYNQKHNHPTPIRSYIYYQKDKKEQKVGKDKEKTESLY